MPEVNKTFSFVFLRFTNWFASSDISKQDVFYRKYFNTDRVIVLQLNHVGIASGNGHDNCSFQSDPLIRGLIVISNKSSFKINEVNQINALFR